MERQLAGNQEVYSANFTTGTRSYFVNMLEAKNSTKYVKITESRKKDDGNFEKQRIMLFQGDLYKLAKVLNTAIGKISGKKEEGTAEETAEGSSCGQENAPEMTLGLEEQPEVAGPDGDNDRSKDLFPNSGKKWTTEDEEKLEFLFKAGKTVEDLTEIFGRKKTGIESRLQKLGLKE